ncbi:MAG: T9SS type A sorting domain-containing protein [Bacteroidales bacterium]|nr:T9SS type A sorting domain-containing protein [Bacteroidales bacterium]
MKKSILILAVLVMTFKFSNGQTNVYHPFPESNVIWVGRYWYMVGGSGPIVDDDYNLYIGGDTTIGIYTYHILYKNGYMSSIGPPPGYYYYGRYYGAFRQDSTNKKIYLYENGVDTLAYDFNLNIGDTLPITYLYVGFKNIVQSIDSVLIGNQYHKRYWLNDNYAALIEGIGTTLGAFAPIAPIFEFGNDLWCVRINNQIAWTSSPGNECRLTSIIENAVAENQILIAPNPTYNKITIANYNKFLGETTISVLNMKGEQVKQDKFQNQNPIEMDVSMLAKGIYLVKIQSKLGIESKKLVIQ